MRTQVHTVGLDLPERPAPRAADRLPPGIALPIIGLLSMAGWYAVWKLAHLILF